MGRRLGTPPVRTRSGSAWRRSGTNPLSLFRPVPTWRKQVAFGGHVGKSQGGRSQPYINERPVQSSHGWDGVTKGSVHHTRLPAGRHRGHPSSVCWGTCPHRPSLRSQVSSKTPQASLSFHIPLHQRGVDPGWALKSSAPGPALMLTLCVTPGSHLPSPSLRLLL